MIFINKKNISEKSISLLGNNKGMSITNVWITLSVLSVILLGIFGMTGKLGELIDNKKDISFAGANIVTTTSQYLSNTGSIDFMNASSSEYTNSGYSLDEDKILNLEFNKNIFGANGTGSLEVTFDNTSLTSYLGIDLNSGTKNVSSYSFDNGVILDDSSLWTASQRTTYKNEQLGYIKSGNFSSGSFFISSWLEKINTAGAFAIFDFGKNITLNTFDIGFSENVGTTTPKLISLTFDDGTRYNFSLDTSKMSQKLTFMDTKTRYVKFDIIATNDGEGNISNTALASVTNILPADISVVKTSDDITLTFPSVSDSLVKYYNIYFGYGLDIPINPAIIVPQKGGMVEVYYKNTSSGSLIPNNVWIEPCSMQGICKNKIQQGL